MRSGFLFAIIISIIFCAPVLAVNGDMGVGTEPLTDGSMDFPWLIEDLADFLTFTSTPSYWLRGVYTRLESDLDLSTSGTYTRAPIAGDPDSDYIFDGIGFAGNFDGNGHVISNLTVEEVYYCGLFGKLDVGSEVNNLGLEGILLVNGVQHVGGLTSWNLGRINNCYVTGEIIGDDNAGGLVGVNDKGTISHSYLSGTVTGEDNTGGLVGYNYYGSIKDCYLIGTVTGGYDTGGLVGYGYYGNIVDCYSAGVVTGNDDIGGLVGVNDEGSIRNCYSTGAVTGEDYIGGLAGYNYYGSITDCYSSSTVAGEDYASCLVGLNSHATISHCYTTGAIAGSRYVGGLTGYNYYGTISHSGSDGEVSGSDSHIGGLVGNNNDGGISGCYSTGIVTGHLSVGGIVGWNEYGSITSSYSSGDVTGDIMSGGLVGVNFLGTITNSYSTGLVTSETGTGGLAGLSLYDSITSSFWDVESSGVGIAGDDNYGAIGRTTAEMMTFLNFTDAGWDFVGETINGTDDIWFMRDGIEYPRLFALNCKPMADAGDNQTVYAWVDGLAQVQLDGTGSYDADGDALEYFWYDANELIATGPEPNVLFGVGEYEVTLIVNDGIEDSEPNSCVVTVEPAVEVSVVCTPKSLNCESHGRWIKAHFTMPAEYTIDDVNTSIPCTLEPFGLASNKMQSSNNEQGQVVLTVSFDRGDFCDMNPPGGFLQLTAVGRLNSGHYFYASDTIRILDTKMEHLLGLAAHWLEEGCGKPDWCEGQDVNRDTVVNLNDFALSQ